MKYEEAEPNPEHLIRSISEQGYSFESSLADLIDNSISAEATGVEILIDMDKEPFTLFLSDDGTGMSESVLKSSMQFPSSSPAFNRDKDDLGRFGLGMKTASFSQTRSFTVLSRKKGDQNFSGRTWDVDYLKKKEKWHLIVNTKEEVESLLEDYQKISGEYLGEIENFTANTIVVWKGLYKFEDYLNAENRKKALQKQLNEVTADHLSLVFHRFLERRKLALRIRVNNKQISPFDPFPPTGSGVRKIESKRRSFFQDSVKLEGFVLPAHSVNEAKSGVSKWTTKKRSLTDMEGIYVYRADRIIIYGGWNGLIRKGPRLQLARLRVDVGNKVDHLLHLNVSKSQITIPHDLKVGFEHYVNDLKIEAEREFHNRGIRKLSNDDSQNKEQLFKRIACSKGTLVELNENYPIINDLKNSLSKKQQTKLTLLFRMVNTMINKTRLTHETDEFLSNADNSSGVSEASLKEAISLFSKLGWSEQQIRTNFITELGFNEDSVPSELFKD
ncbi:ATP-binding protein [bacterium]|nr:ATP-binding protein [bacterium]